MDAYSPADQHYARVMEFVREDKKGDRFYTYAVRNQTGSVIEPTFLYRAMKRSEATDILAKNVNPDPNGHHGWSSYRDFSFEYLTRKNGYTHLVEVKAPNFIPWMKEIGFVSGKAEGGDMSWGIGGKSSNGWRGTKETNEKLMGEYAKYINNGVRVKHTSVKGGYKEMAKQLAPSIFKSAIEYVKLVDLRSQNPRT